MRNLKVKKIIENKTINFNFFLNLFLFLDKIKLYESEKDLCSVVLENLKACNELSNYCDSYQIEFSEEILELEDLMLYFKKYLEKF